MLTVYFVGLLEPLEMNALPQGITATEFDSPPLLSG